MTPWATAGPSTRTGRRRRLDGRPAPPGNVAYDGINDDFSLYTDTGSKYIDIGGNVVYGGPEDSFATGGCHTVGHIRITGNWFSTLGPLYPCDLAVDVVTTGTSLVCSTIVPGQVPNPVLDSAGLEASWRSLIDRTPPQVVAAGPAQLPTGGGWVLISGSGFTTGTDVDFGSVPAVAVDVLSGNYLLAQAPPESSGIQATVTVTTPAGQSDTASAPTVSWEQVPEPCIPLYSGNLSTAEGR